MSCANVLSWSSVRAITDIRVDIYETTSIEPTVVDEDEDNVGAFLSDVDLDLQNTENNNDDGDGGGHAQWSEDLQIADAEDYDMLDIE